MADKSSDSVEIIADKRATRVELLEVNVFLVQANVLKKALTAHISNVFEILAHPARFERATSASGSRVLSKSAIVN